MLVPHEPAPRSCVLVAEVKGLPKRRSAPEPKVNWSCDACAAEPLFERRYGVGAIRHGLVSVKRKDLASTTLAALVHEVDE